MKHIFAFHGIAPSTLCTIDLNPFDEGGIFGSGDDEKAKALGKDAIKQWTDLQGQIPGATVNPNTGEVTYDQSLSFSANPMDSTAWNAADIHGYQAGPALKYEGIDYADPGKTSWDGVSSSYDDFDPLGESQGREQQIGASGYYRNLMGGGRDAIADADFARKRGAIDQARRGQTEAALQQLEQRGQGGGSEGLLAELVNNQGAASSGYQSALDAAATAQARRDNAAGQYATIGQGMASQDITADSQKASGQDAFTANKQNATDTWQKGVRDYSVDLAKYNADQKNAANKYNKDRGASVSDANTALQNKLGEWNAVGQQQQRFGNQVTLAGGATGATGNAAKIYQEAAVHPLQEVILPAVSDVAKAAVQPPRPGA